jgi:Fe-S-cluster-containing hydrogenase components 1
MSENNQRTEALKGSSASAATQKPKTFTRRSVLAMAGTGVVGLVAGGVLSQWGVTTASIASGRVTIVTTPTKMIVTDRARCSGCQRCEMSCSLKNEGRISQRTARVRVWPNYNFGAGVDTKDGSFENCQFTVQHCKQCDDAACMNYCPVHAIYSDKESGTRKVNEELCIGCGMCSAACPWNMPVVDSESGKSTKCVACGRCADQCPNGAIKFIDWEDIADLVIEKDVVSTTSLVDL